MKRLFSLLLLLTLLAAPAAAQKDLCVERLFDGSLRARTSATEVVVKGKSLEAYNLTLFRSITLKSTPSETRTIESWVRTDGKKAVTKVENFVNTSQTNTRLSYAFYELPAERPRQRRYITYSNRTPQSEQGGTLTVIYMEGSASPMELKRHFAE